MIRPYQQFASSYDQYQLVFTRLYSVFLKKVFSLYGIFPDRILDLGCGTGTLLARIGKQATKRVGLDLSPEMLDVARENDPEGEFVVGDFRYFSLSRKFDLILSCFDSLNYIEDLKELDSVFSRVNEHLDKGGYFIFDTVNEKHFLQLDGGTVAQSPNTSFQNRITYDTDKKIMTSQFYFNQGVEVHRQIPIELEDVQHYAERCGLIIRGVFSGFEMREADAETQRHFYILSNSGNGEGDNVHD